METIQAFLSNDAGPIAQFIKYALVGGIASSVNILTFYLVAFLIFPCLTEQDFVVQFLRRFFPSLKLRPSTRDRATNAIFCNIIGFFTSNTVCYTLNRLFVFKPGAHSMFLEAFLFFGASAISTFFGTAIQTLLIKKLNWQTTLAFSANFFTALAINYAARKFFIFSA